jgi:hypothetical protein
MMRRVQAALLWLMDVMVGVFIGPIDRGERARKVRRIVSRRGMYAIGFASAMMLVVTAYTLATRWPSGTM